MKENPWKNKDKGKSNGQARKMVENIGKPLKMQGKLKHTNGTQKDKLANTSKIPDLIHPSRFVWDMFSPLKITESSILNVFHQTSHFFQSFFYNVQQISANQVSIQTKTIIIIQFIIYIYIHGQTNLPRMRSDSGLADSVPNRGFFGAGVSLLGQVGN